MNESQLAIANSAIVSGDDEKAISILEPLCNSGNVEAMAMLGTLYSIKATNAYEGKRAVTLLSCAAEHGSGLAAHNLATAFVTGLPGVPRDVDASRRYLQLARDLGVALFPEKFYD